MWSNSKVSSLVWSPPPLLFTDHRAGIVYHLHDTVYLPPAATSPKLLRLAQIIEILPKNSRAVVRFFERRGEDPHRLVLRPDLKEVIELRTLQGKFRLVHWSMITRKYASNVEDYTRDESNFWCDESRMGPTSPRLPLKADKLLPCLECSRADEQYKADTDRLKSIKLVAMDTYSGVGGLSLGIETSWYVPLSFIHSLLMLPAFSPAIKTKYAIDFNEHPLQILKCVHRRRFDPPILTRSPE